MLTVKIIQSDNAPLELDNCNCYMSIRELKHVIRSRKRCKERFRLLTPTGEETLESQKLIGIFF